MTNIRCLNIQHLCVCVHTYTHKYCTYSVFLKATSCMLKYESGLKCIWVKNPKGSWYDFKLPMGLIYIVASQCGTKCFCTSAVSAVYTAQLSQAAAGNMLSIILLFKLKIAKE